MCRHKILQLLIEMRWQIRFLTSVAPGSSNVITVVHDTSLTVTWAPPTSGGSPTSYNVSINDSIGTPWIIPDDGSPSYTLMFPGLTSNTLYSVTLVAINCAGSTGITVNNYTRKKLELKCFVLHGFICLVKLHM